jgi:hypothetical protein
LLLYSPPVKELTGFAKVFLGAERMSERLSEH